MKIEVDVPDYRPEVGVRTDWENGFAIDVRVDLSEVVIRANAAGLRSLASHLLTLASNAVPVGAHVHYDQSNSLEDGSTGLIVERA